MNDSEAEAFAIAYIGVGNGQFKVAVELRYADDLQSCFENAVRASKLIFPDAGWKRDFVIQNADGSSVYSTYDEAETKTIGGE